MLNTWSEVGLAGAIAQWSVSMLPLSATPHIEVHHFGNPKTIGALLKAPYVKLPPEDLALLDADPDKRQRYCELVAHSWVPSMRQLSEVFMRQVGAESKSALRCDAHVVARQSFAVDLPVVDPPSPEQERIRGTPTRGISGRVRSFASGHPTTESAQASTSWMRRCMTRARARERQGSRTAAARTLSSSSSRGAVFSRPRISTSSYETADKGPVQNEHVTDYVRR